MTKLIRVNPAAKTVTLLLAIVLWFLIKKNVETRNQPAPRYYLRPPDAAQTTP